MEKTEENKPVSADEIFNDIKGDYPDVERVVMEDEEKTVFCIYASDDVLWKIFEDWMELVASIEFNAGTNEEHYLKVIP
ncbi:hypothetical protein [Methanobacterium formicicum]|jgi:hypothetical protein|uniref:Uncharacterized protein n=1 Tax=Methanobacterium formicicum (strain DSM 3637 / PP1) TaxID=1204725 RepID=K2RA44_METFP|nr:hypothetical protein [Methanobacterium formicicum]EKF85194.1 hypothetical protein A994_09943 [Methanobacterium formicicum DSM 3637]